MTISIQGSDEKDLCRDPACKHHAFKHRATDGGCVEEGCGCKEYTVIPPNWPCRRCEHPSSEHREENGGCSVELSPTSVPSLDLGRPCSCRSFVFEPAPQARFTPEPEWLDGPAMLADGLKTLSAIKARSMGNVEWAMACFAGATAAAMAELAIDNATGDIAERRWRAALAGAPLAPLGAPQDGGPRA